MWTTYDFVMFQRETYTVEKLHTNQSQAKNTTLLFDRTDPTHGNSRDYSLKMKVSKTIHFNL